MGPPSYIRSVVDRNVIMGRIHTHTHTHIYIYIYIYILRSNDRFNERGDRAYRHIFIREREERHANHLSHSVNHKLKRKHSMTRSVGCRQLRHMTTLVNKLNYLRLCLTRK